MKTFFYTFSIYPKNKSRTTHVVRAKTLSMAWVEIEKWASEQSVPIENMFAIDMRATPPC